ncbi:MAG: RnfABCDGE type electron transport complex subunit D [Gemmobacter sp.]|nr:RnfABCDGE type electron transport complex subunit D [Gemmobacter sp.]
MTGSAPFVPRRHDANRLTLLALVAILPPVSVALAERGAAALGVLGVAVILAVIWAAVFARVRGRPFGWDSLVTALVFAALVPDAVPLWQVAIGFSFGLVMGDLIFGGRGRGFLSPAAVGLAFLLFSFPVPDMAMSGMAARVAALGAAAILLVSGLLSWRVVAGFAAGVIGLSFSAIIADVGAFVPSATLLLGLVFLVGDPVAGASTNVGRWAYGLLAGALFVLLRLAGGIDLPAIVFAALLASIFAPLIDQAVIWANVRRRARRQRDV